jgi:curli biogenesis system outer membrane secretion channel CsgG
LVRTAVLLVAATSSGCSFAPWLNRTAIAKPVVLVAGPPVGPNHTPLDGVLDCFSEQLASTGSPHLRVAVGDVKDYTAKYSINEGNAISQGGALMVYSALGRFHDSIDLIERYDTQIAEKELGYTDRRQLGDGSLHHSGGPQDPTVPWIPYYGGSILKSDYYIVGGITELNYNIHSGGAIAEVSQIGPNVSVYRSGVAIDLRIVDTSTLRVVKTVSISKQIVGYQVAANVFKFFGSDLWNLNVGEKSQEPMQLGVRTALQEGVVELLAAVTHQDLSSCVDKSQYWKFSSQPSATKSKATKAAETPARPADVARVQPTAPAREAVASSGDVAPAPTNMMIVGQFGNSASADIEIPFDITVGELSSAGRQSLQRVVESQKRERVTVTLVARVAENITPAQRRSLAEQRASAVKAALDAEGVPTARVSVTWLPDPSDSGMVADGPGMQVVGRLTVERAPVTLPNRGK